MVKEKYDISKIRFGSYEEAYDMLDRMTEYGHISLYDYYSLVGFLGLRDEEMDKYLEMRELLEEDSLCEIAYTAEELEQYRIVRYRDGYSITKEEKKPVLKNEDFLSMKQEDVLTVLYKLSDRYKNDKTVKDALGYAIFAVALVKEEA